MCAFYFQKNNPQSERKNVKYTSLVIKPLEIVRLYLPYE